MRKFQIRTISKSLMENIETTPTRIELFNFLLDKKKIGLVKYKRENIVGTSEATWIRIYDQDENYYDFITSSVFYVSNKNGVLLLCSEDSEYVSFEYISKLIHDFMTQLKKQDAIDAEKYMLGYTKALGKELTEAYKNLNQLYSVDSQSKRTRLSMEDSLVHARTQLTRKYLVGLIAKKLIKENGKEILEILKSDTN